MTNDANRPANIPPSKLVFACSGAADVGEISDKAARKLTKDGIGKMFCLAGIGGRIQPVMATTKSASLILAIDGCAMDCVKNCLKQAGFNNFQHLRITDMGLEKGKSPATDRRVAEVAERAEDLLNNE
ncbi:MAG TPA: putative zinc-binding protein [Sedimentisphaerales bacterium]|nr:putative zinc-binding protein [Sedimentisphaerales bacterium]